MSFSRRDFVRASAAIPFATWFSQHGLAQTSAVRYEVLTPQGQAMVKKYAAAVAKMMAAPKTSPLGWTFQWYTHFAPTAKPATITAIYGATPSPQRSLAGEMWNTCQSHMGQPEDYFLPWHRMYVFFFESIIRSVLADNSFTLPYWNYSAAGSAHGVLPAAFRASADPLLKSLFLPNRNNGVNSGTPIDASQPHALDPDSLTQTTYSASGPKPGFCGDLDAKLHGNVHVLVGNSTDMGQIPTAAGDPIFWMHHCNIDRLWASWNKAGRANPKGAAFLSKTFVFADHTGKRVVAKIGDFLDIAPLHYTYDSLEPVPSAIGAHAAAPGTPRPPATVASAATITLSAKPLRVPLAKPFRGAAITPQGPGGPVRYYVVVQGLNSDRQPGVLYNLYLNLPDATSDATNAAHLIGSINFFGAMSHGLGADAHAMSSKFISFDITPLVQRLGAQAVSGDLHVTIAPAGAPQGEAQPTLASLKIVSAQ
jgi:tyrosinase